MGVRCRSPFIFSFKKLPQLTLMNTKTLSVSKGDKGNEVDLGRGKNSI